MPVYTVHAPSAAAEIRNATDRFAFVRDGFSFWAFVGGVLWLAYHRQWLALLGYIAVTVAATVALSLLHAGAGVEFAVMFLIALLLGLEGGTLRRWTLSRQKYRQLDIVVADDEEAAERRFFDRWTARHRDAVDNLSAVDRGAPPPARDVPAQTPSQPVSSPHASSQHGDIIGLFPQPGAPR